MKTCAFAIMFIFTAFSCGSDSKKHPIPEKDYNNDKMEQGRVFVLSIPDWGVTPFASGRDAEKIAREIDQYNAINREITLSRGIEWIDVTGISRLAKEDKTLIASDGLHPSEKMYTEWVRPATPEILKMLKEE